MSHYRRLKCPGGTYFFTSRLADQQSTLLIDHIGLLRTATRQTCTRYPFRIDAIVVLPAAIHTIWTLPSNDDDFCIRWRYLKTQFSCALPPTQSRTLSQITRREKGIWQRRFWEHLIRDPHDFATHTRMIHCAPVAAGLVKNPTDWAWSSIHRAQRETGQDGISNLTQPLSGPAARHITIAG